ncbi:hypothetical protein yc1106_03401 [Curvularia clavata]|uniref:Uncharacterized protein n=1 Tax=Curvularia clavata TaxID=95742 RepID=A0A9Q8Z5N9_CURCL|nr:hypothetical protein yc1106_03401 [Curvularia clavata]
MKSESPSVSDSAVGNVTNEAVLKEISAQLRSNKKHVKKLRREVRDNKEDTKNLLMKLRQEFQVNKKHLKTLHREVQDGKKEIEDCKKRLNAMAYNNMARTINQGLKDTRSELMPLRNHRNEVIEGVPDWVESFWSLTGQFAQVCKMASVSVPLDGEEMFWKWNRNGAIAVLLNWTSGTIPRSVGHKDAFGLDEAMRGLEIAEATAEFKGGIQHENELGVVEHCPDWYPSEYTHVKIEYRPHIYGDGDYPKHTNELPYPLTVAQSLAFARPFDMATAKQKMVPRTWKMPLATSNTTNPLAASLALYPVLETLVSFLPPFDVVTLTQVSQTLHAHIRMHDATVKGNILSKTLCPGLGCYMRSKLHCACAAKNFRQSIRCTSDGFGTESRPCVECGVNTCDECRIHIFYNYLAEDAQYDQRRWWAGFFFLNAASIAVFPPKNGDASAWYRPVKEMEPLHDQGRFHIPLHIPAIGDPEPIDKLLDVNLGERQVFVPTGRTQYPYSGNEIVSYLNTTVVRRKELLCSACFQKRHKPGSSPCSCTLRKRFLDRWVCVGCYTKENESDKAISSHVVVHDADGSGHRHLCGCGASFGAGPQPKILCNWCKGEVTGEWDDASNEIGDEDPEDPENPEHNEDDAEQDEEHSAADFAYLGPGELGYARNRDTSLSVYVDGTRIRGEQLGRGIIRRWRVEEGLPEECTCCLCGDGNVRRKHEGHDDDNEEWETDEEGYTVADGNENG